MWKNIRISFKLLLGFGLLLLIFGLSVAVTWRNMSAVRNESDFLAQGVVPAMLRSSELERDAYELFYSMRGLQFRESPEDLNLVNSRQAKIKEVFEGIDRLYQSQPQLQGLQYVRDKVLPVYGDYVAMVEKTVPVIARKKELYSEITKAGEEMDAVAAEITDVLFSTAKEEAGNGEPERILHRLDLLRIGVDIDVGTTDLRRAIQRAVAGGSVDEAKKTLELLAKIEKNARALEAVTTDPQRRAMVDRLIQGGDAYKAALENFVATFTELTALHNSRPAIMEAFSKESTAASNLSQNRVETVAKESVVSLGQSIFILISSAALSIVLGLGIALIISRGISKPLGTIVGLARRGGEGDLTIERKDFAYQGKDELGMLADALSAMLTAQADTMQKVIAVAQSLSDGAENLSAISEETNAAMEEVKASVDQVATLSEGNGAALQECNAGVEEMSAGADTVAQSATDSAAFIAETTDASNRAVQTVNDVIHGMHGVEGNAKITEEKIKQLIVAVENVSGFVSVITGIADQTNLLALNAAIEAARAGEAGRGFAVVAEEVRKLAEESARAAQSVNGIILELQSGAQESIEATTEAGRTLMETLSHAEGAQTGLNGALKEMNKANDSIQNIAAVAEEQAASSKEVATAIDSATRSTMEMVETISNIRRATDETAQAAQGVAEQSEAMSAHAHDLTNVLSRFKVKAASAKLPQLSS